MRTTVTLDDDVERLLRDEMHRSRISFKACLNRAVRDGLASNGAQPKLEPFVVEAQNMGMLPGIDPAKFNQLADELEVEALVERMRAFEAESKALRQRLPRSRRA